MTSPPKSPDKNLPSETTLLSQKGLPCMERLNDESDVHFKDKATAMRKAPRLSMRCSARPWYVVGSNFSRDKSGQFDILPFKHHRRSCMNSSRFRFSGQPRGLKLAPATS